MTVPFHLEIEHRISVLVDRQIFLLELMELRSVTDQVIFAFSIRLSRIGIDKINPLLECSFYCYRYVYMVSKMYISYSEIPVYEERSELLFYHPVFLLF